MSTLMATLLLAQHATPWHGMSISNLAITIVVIIGIIALVLIFVKAMNFQIPDWFKQVLWVVAAVVVVCVAIIFISSFWAGG